MPAARSPAQCSFLDGAFFRAGFTPARFFVCLLRMLLIIALLGWEMLGAVEIEHTYDIWEFSSKDNPRVQEGNPLNAAS